MASNRTISRPNSKLSRLCAEASARTGKLGRFKDVADAAGVSPSRISQVFGHGCEADGSIASPDLLGALIRAFEKIGIKCEIDWLFEEYSHFSQLLIERNGLSGTAPHGGDVRTDWKLTASSALKSLVELRFHYPRPGNEVEGSFYVYSTLLFNRAVCDYEPEQDDPGFPDARSIVLGLKSAKLAIGDDAFQPLQGTFLGETSQSEYAKRVAGGADIIGPLSNECIVGDPIGATHIGVIAKAEDGADEFSLTVTASRDSFHVEDPKSPPGSQNEARIKNAILTSLVYRNIKKDAEGRAIVARAVMKRVDP